MTLRDIYLQLMELNKQSEALWNRIEELQADVASLLHEEEIAHIVDLRGQKVRIKPEYEQWCLKEYGHSTPFDLACLCTVIEISTMLGYYVQQRGQFGHIPLQMVELWEEPKP